MAIRAQFEQRVGHMTPGLDLTADGALRFSTKGLRNAERAPAFEAAIATLGFRQGLSGIEGNLDARFVARRLGPISTCEFQSTRLEARRTSRHIAQAPLDSIFIQQQLGAEGSLFAAPNLAQDRIHPGELIVSNCDEFSDVLTDGNFHHRAWVLPRAIFTRADLNFGLLEVGLRLPADHPMACIVLGYLDAFLRQSSRLTEAEAEKLATTAAQLLTVAASGTRGDERLIAASREGQLVRAKHVIAEELCDPLLSPARVAARLGISIRKLHALFEVSGESFGQFVRARRLARARAQILDPLLRHRSIAEIAFDHGFNSLSAFYQAYRNSYGEAPGSTRATIVDAR